MMDPITDDDLIAFVDGQIDPMRRLDVEAHLAAHPGAAAQVMADLLRAFSKVFMDSNKALFSGTSACTRFSPSLAFRALCLTHVSTFTSVTMSASSSLFTSTI